MTLRKLKLILIVFLTLYMSSCSHQEKNIVTFGVITDVHQDLQKDAQARLSVFIDQAIETNPNFIIQLGDLSHGQQIDSILQVWNRFEGKNYHVLGNHDSDNLVKDSVVAKQNMAGKYYSFDNGGVHFIVLDLNYILEDGEYQDFGLGKNYRISPSQKNLISPEQLKWLDRDLSTTKKPTVVYSHQGIGRIWEGYLSPSAEDIRQVLEKHNTEKEKKVIACFSGDQHVDAYEEVNGIHYFQVNSASYFWIEEAALYSNGHMAVYKDPLYAFVTIDLQNKTIEMKGTTSEFLPPAPTKDNYSKPHKVFAEIKSRKVSF